MAASVLLLVAAIVTISIPGAFAGLGLDVSSSYSTTAWNCWQAVNSGFNVAVVRAGKSTGAVDTAAPQSLKNAQAAGYAYRHVYIFPCAHSGCPSASTQATQMIDYLRNNGAPFTKVWIDVEGPASTYWTSNTATNEQFLINLIGGLKSKGLTTSQIGIYTSKSQWQPIMGTADFHSYALWYAHYDGNFNFNDFVAFNGWTTPCMKQYAGDQTIGCNGGATAGADKNYYSSTSCF
jgi:GH25 family lysozyme M1 (1,4-beta-N-acetylmuramidase)